MLFILWPNLRLKLNWQLNIIKHNIPFLAKPVAEVSMAYRTTQQMNEARGDPCPISSPSVLPHALSLSHAVPCHPTLLDPPLPASESFFLLPPLLPATRAATTSTGPLLPVLESLLLVLKPLRPVLELLLLVLQPLLLALKPSRCLSPKPPQRSTPRGNTPHQRHKQALLHRPQVALARSPAPGTKARPRSTSCTSRRYSPH